MTVALADVRHVELVLRGTSNAQMVEPQSIVNVFHYRRTGITVDPVKANIITGFHDSVATVVALALNASYSLDAIDCRYLEDITDPYLTAPQADIGAIAGDRVSSKLAVYLLKRTPYRGKSYRGGWHFGPISESDTTSALSTPLVGAETLNAAAYDRFVDIADAVMAGFASSEGNNWVPVLWSKRQSDMSPTPAEIRTYDLSQILVRRNLGTMKSRSVKSHY